MTSKLAWWKLCLFAVITCGALFFFPPTNQLVLIVWMVVMYGGIAVWLKSNSSTFVEQEATTSPGVAIPVAEFLDEDRLYLQQHGDETMDDGFLYDPHEIF